MKNDDDDDNDSIKAGIQQAQKKDGGEDNTNAPKTSRSTNELSQFIGPFQIDLAHDNVETFTATIDRYITEQKSHIKGDYPDGFQIVFKLDILQNILKLKKVRDYRDITLLAIQKEPTVHDDQGDQGANDGQKSRLSDD
jgi:hypothetical protein